MRGAYVGGQDEQFSVISNHLTFANATGTLIPPLAKGFQLPSDPNFPKFDPIKNPPTLRAMGVVIGSLG